ncbi:Rv3654c family TadE-like protein [Streptomyces sp. NPDC001744]|uniref:Rv3654c family TadE-like protein n=1 Tax=Streptomyces sp. NPDC001744 TaxID=3364606 RepID=UPI0036BDF64C
MTPGERDGGRVRARARAPGRGQVRTGAGDRGAATVWAAFAACALCVVFGAVLALGQATAARHRAGGAADMAALAAADRALRGEEEACAAASRVAGAQGVELVRCAVRGELAEVTARVVRGPYRPEVRSRAGPSEPRPATLPAPVELPDPAAPLDPAALLEPPGSTGLPEAPGSPELPGPPVPPWGPGPPGGTP